MPCYCCCSLLACMHACIFFRVTSWAYGSRGHWGLTISSSLCGKSRVLPWVLERNEKFGASDC
jgi:hypothetical protein